MMPPSKPAPRRRTPQRPLARPVIRLALLMLLAVPLITACPGAGKKDPTSTPEPAPTITSLTVTPNEVTRHFGQFTISWNTSNTTNHVCHLGIWVPGATNRDITDLGSVHCNDFTTHAPDRPGEYQYILSIRNRNTNETVTREPSSTVNYRAPDPGTELWTRQFGTSSLDYGTAVATDANGNSIVVGMTRGSLAGTSQGELDAYVRKYDSNGNIEWTSQYGTDHDDWVYAVATDSDGNIIVTGYIYDSGSTDAYVHKFDSNGNLKWTHQYGTDSFDEGRSVATDSDGNIIVVGATNGSLESPNQGEYDAYVRKYDPNGNIEWAHQYGNDHDDWVYAVATDTAGNIIVTGYTRGSLEGPNQGGSDAYVRKYDPNGNLKWAQQYGTDRDDRAHAVATDTAGNIIVTGNTRGSLEGPNQGGSDAYVRKYDPNGNLKWAQQYGTNSFDDANGVATDADGNIFVTGNTRGSVEGTNQGGEDAYVRKYSP